MFVQDGGFYFHGGGGFQAARTPSFREYRACATAQRAGNIRSAGEAGSNRLKLGAFCPPPPSAAFVVQVCLALRASSYPDWQIAPLLAFLSSFLSFFSLRAPSLRAPRRYLRNLDGINYTGFARLSLSPPTRNNGRRIDRSAAIIAGS